MIVGEAEVQGQVKRAYELALAAGTTGPLTNRLFRAALPTGKRVRTETAIGEGARQRLVGRRRRSRARMRSATSPTRHVVIIGAGETGELTAQALADAGRPTIFVANRRADRARSIAERFGGSVVVASTSCPTRLERGRHRRRVDVVAAPDRRRRGARSSSWRARDGRAAAARSTSPCRATSSRRAPTLAGRHAVRHRRPPGGRARATCSVRAGRGARAPRRSSRRRSSASPRWLGTLEVLPTIAALREHGDDDRRAGAGRERRPLGERVARATAQRVEAIARAVDATGCCTSRRCA